MSFVSLERSGVIATVTLNRPERLNALGRELLSDFHSVLTEAAAIGSNVRFLICKRTLGEAPANDRFWPKAALHRHRNSDRLYHSHEGLESTQGGRS
jgi:hypothetical protein